jgi:hypothetical protein
VLQLFDCVAKFWLVGPAIVPYVELQKIDSFHPELFANALGVLKNVVWRKDIVVLVFWGRRPFVVQRRNLGSCIQVLVVIARHDFAQEAVALAVSVSPSCIEKIAAEVDGKLQRLQ